jgi:hypothetical protein
MSKQNNVNPGQYKVAGRERTGNTGNAAAKDSQQPQAVNRGIEHVPDSKEKKRLKNREQ